MASNKLNRERGPFSGRNQNTGFDKGGVVTSLRESYGKIKSRLMGYRSPQYREVVCHVCGWVMDDSCALLNTSEYYFFCPICGNCLEVENL